MIGRETGWPPEVWEKWTVRELESFLEALTDILAAEDYRDWHRFAFLASVIANVNQGRRGRKFRPEDFIGKPPWEKKKKPAKKSREDKRRELEELKQKFGEQ